MHRNSMIHKLGTIVPSGIADFFSWHISLLLLHKDVDFVSWYNILSILGLILYLAVE